MEGEVGKLVLNKMAKFFNKNSEFDTMCKIVDVLSATKYSLHKELETGSIYCFKYAPLSSVIVERSFSIYEDKVKSSQPSLQLT